jgi:predicted DNA-binding transcriptional regulator YafY
MSNRDTSVAALAAERGVKPATLYRYVDANGNLRDHGKRVLSA